MSPSRIERLTAFVVLSLGTVVLVGGVVGVVDGVREDGEVAPLRLLVMLLVVLAMRRAAPKARRLRQG